MAIKITAKRFLENHSLEVQSDGVTFVETALTGGKHQFRFGDIECILLSEDHLLSIQVAGKAYAIPTDPGDEKHQTAISTLVEAVKNAGAGWASQ